jgi:hypothetical protein
MGMQIALVPRSCVSKRRSTAVEAIWSLVSNGSSPSARTLAWRARIRSPAEEQPREHDIKTANGAAVPSAHGAGCGVCKAND